MALPRLLVAAGVPDQPWQAERTGRPVLRRPSLHRLAGLTISKDDTGMHLRKWREFRGRDALDGPEPPAGAMDDTGRG